MTAHRTRRNRGGSWGSRSWALVLVLGALLAGATAAFAVWTVSVLYAPTNYALAQAATLSAPTAPTATMNGSGAITIGWTLPVSQLTGAQYKVTRSSGPGSPSTVCTVAFTVTSCQDTGLTATTTYGYSVAAVLGTNWQSSTITTSATTATPTLSIGLSPSPYTAGSAITVQTVTAKIGAQVDTTYSGAKAINWSGLATSPSGQAPAYPTSSLTFASGVASPSATFMAYAATTSSTLTGTDAGASTVTGSVSFVVSPATASQFSVPTPGTQTAGIQFNETVTAQDPYQNTATGYSGNKTLTYTGTGAPGTAPDGTHTPVYPTNPVSFSAGQATLAITLYKAESPLLQVSDSTISGSSASFTVNPASASQFSVPTPGTQTAGVQFNETVTAQDAYRNTAAYSGNKTLTYTGSGVPGTAPDGTHTPAYPTNPVSFSAGQAILAITLYKAESPLLRVSDGTITGASASFAVDSAGVTLSFSPNPGNVAKNSTTSFTVTVPNDAYGNPFTSAAGITVNLSLSNTANWGFGAVGTGTKALAITSGPANNTFTVVESGANKSSSLTGTTTAPGFTAPASDSLHSGG